MQTRRLFTTTLVFAATAAMACAQRPSPAAQTSATIAGKKITINYSAPSVRGRKVPAGKYTLFVLLDKAGWKLIVNKQTGQGGLDYDEKQDLGRVPMKMAKTPALVETYKMTLTPTGGNKGRLTLEWENTSASVD